jgi:mono/diheme cytochrome c family protein
MKIPMNKRAMRPAMLTLICGLWLATFVFAASVKKDTKEATVSPVVHINDADIMRVQGEQRFRANCGRCHAAPQKFPPRMMATVVRHMRVRALITDEDMRLVLFYMTQ